MSEVSLAHIRAVRENARCLFTLRDVEKAVDGLAAAVSRAYRQRDPLLLTVMNGGVVFAGMLLPRLDFPLQADYVHASRYRGETAGSELQWKVAPSGVEGRHVLILDDILDVGTTLCALVEHCKQQGAASVATAVLVDKRHERKASPGLRADYTALEAGDAYLFGCGMDYREYWRNAPGIFAVEGG